MAAHRYWRANITANNGRNWCGIARFQVRETPDGPDIVSSGTVTTSSTYSGYPASNMTDGDQNTFWHSGNNALPEWIKIDFGAGNDKDISTVLLSARPDSFSSSDSPSALSWQYSDDNSSWTTAFSVTGQTDWAWYEPRSFTNYADATGQVLYSGNANGYSASSVSSLATAARATTTGRHVFVAVSWNGADTTASLTDTAGNTYTSVSKAVNTAEANVCVQWFSCLSATGHASNVVTVSLTAARTVVGITAIELESSSAPTVTSATVVNTSGNQTTSAFTSVDLGMFLACVYATSSSLLFCERIAASDRTPFVGVTRTGSYVAYQKIYDGAAGESVTQLYGSDFGRGVAMSVLHLSPGAGGGGGGPFLFLMT